MSTILGQRGGFGLVQGLGTADPEGLTADVREAEALGFDMFCLADHLHSERDTLEPWTALTWVAANTTTIEVMPNVLGLPYRAPAVTAKMAETLDRLSAGRLVLGLGTGGYDAEFAAFGLAERTPGQKVEALSEALRIIKGLWGEAIAERLIEVVRAGFTFFNVVLHGPGSRERFATEVMPAVRREMISLAG